MSERRPSVAEELARLVSRVFFEWAYRRGGPRWDTEITPPELKQLVEEEHFPPCRALDIGCGTGTNAIYLARHDFEVIGIDYVPRAIQRARKKASAARVQIDFRVVDVLNPQWLGKPFDFVLDIGCFHSLDPHGRMAYEDNLVRWTHMGSQYLIHTFYPKKVAGRQIGITSQEMRDIFEPRFRLVNSTGQEDDLNQDSAWYRWERK